RPGVVSPWVSPVPVQNWPQPIALASRVPLGRLVDIVGRIVRVGRYPAFPGQGPGRIGALITGQAGEYPDRGILGEARVAPPSGRRPRGAVSPAVPRPHPAVTIEVAQACKVIRPD